MPQVKLILTLVVLVLGWGVALNAGKPERGGGVGRPKYLALGDSYTIGESVDPEDRYPVQVMRLLAQRDHLAIGDPEIVAVTGWTTGNLLEALTAVNAEPENISAKSEKVGASAKSGAVGATAKSEEVGATAKSGAAYDIVSLLICVNNQFQGRSQAEYREQFGQLLQTCIRLAGNRPDHVVVLSI